MMKLIKTTLLALTLLATAGAASARPAHVFYGGFHHPYFGVGVVVDPWPFYYPYAGYYPYGYYPYGYYAPTVVTQAAAPTTYVEQGSAQGAPAASAAPASNDWYFCRKPEGYYPYVRSCPDGWQRVPSQPPAQH